jgi:RNA polymerase sigma-70 factor (ECF subfamily)
MGVLLATADHVTQLLRDWSSGDTAAREKLIPLVYPELRRLARRYMSREAGRQTLQTTALVHEAYLQFAEKTRPHWQNRPQFFAVAAQLMRRIMVNHARERDALKRGGGSHRVTLDEAALVTEQRAAELLALDEALEKLASFDLRKSRIVEMRYFGGLTMEEIAEVLKIHVNTAMRDWSAAKAWLYAALR